MPPYGMRKGGRAGSKYEEDEMDPSLRSALGEIKVDGRRGRVDGLTGPTDMAGTYGVLSDAERGQANGVVGPSDLTGPTDSAPPATTLTPDQEGMVDRAGRTAENVILRGGGVIDNSLDERGLTPYQSALATARGGQAASMLDNALPRNLIPGRSASGGTARGYQQIILDLRRATTDEERNALFNELERGAGDVAGGRR